MNERFSESDLAPSSEERRAALAERLDQLAVVVAVLAVGVVIGGMVALGACAAPFVFRMTPAPSNGDAMGAAFARFDRIAIGGSVVLLAAEVVRTYLARREPRSFARRARRVLAIGFAACTAYVGLSITPAINSLHRSGVVRGSGTEGEALDAIHKRAELFGKIELALGAALVGLHVFTVRSRPQEEFESPIAPGPV